jgi:hypothetical protein
MTGNTFKKYPQARQPFKRGRRTAYVFSQTQKIKKTILSAGRRSSKHAV